MFANVLRNYKINVTLIKHRNFFTKIISFLSLTHFHKLSLATTRSKTPPAPQIYRKISPPRVHHQLVSAPPPLTSPRGPTTADLSARRGASRIYIYMYIYIYKRRPASSAPASHLPVSGFKARYIGFSALSLSLSLSFGSLGREARRKISRYKIHVPCVYLYTHICIHAVKWNGILDIVY